MKPCLWVLTPLTHPLRIDCILWRCHATCPAHALRFARVDAVLDTVVNTGKDCGCRQIRVGIGAANAVLDVAAIGRATGDAE